MNLNRPLVVAALLLAGLFAFHPARAAESYDNCAGTISSLPTTITTQGVWCLKGDLSTAITSGEAITIATNNVTIDCNDFKIGGLAAGNASATYGIYASSRQNITIRHCNIRGFYSGIALSGGAGHLAEDNRLDNNLHFGIYIDGDQSLVRRNRVYSTGGGIGANTIYGIYGSADIIDNIVDGMFVDGGQASGSVDGIFASGYGGRVIGNRVSGQQATSTVSATGINLLSYRQRVSDNQVIGADLELLNTKGIWGSGDTFCKDNTVGGFKANIYNCQDAGGNATN